MTNFKLRFDRTICFSITNNWYRNSFKSKNILLDDLTKLIFNFSKNYGFNKIIKTKDAKLLNENKVKFNNNSHGQLIGIDCILTQLISKSYFIDIICFSMNKNPFDGFSIGFLETNLKNKLPTTLHDFET